MILAALVVHSRTGNARVEPSQRVTWLEEI